jgi:nicotinamidase/pyrazinamidase
MKQKYKTALIVVDLQKEFINGKLSIPYSENLINKINKINKNFDLVCFSKNVFYDIKNDKKENITISDLGYYCKKDTEYVEFPDNLNVNDNIFIRNYGNEISAINSINKDNVTLIDFLKENGITHVFLAGLPADYSIKYTSLDFMKHFETYIIVDAIKTINDLNYFIKYCLNKKIFLTNIEDINIIKNNVKFDNMKKHSLYST